MFMLHPASIKDFVNTHKNNNTRLRYSRTRSYQYLICRGVMTDELKNDIKQCFPDAYITNGNIIDTKRFRINP